MQARDGTNAVCIRSVSCLYTVGVVPVCLVVDLRDYKMGYIKRHKMEYIKQRKVTKNGTK